MSPDTKEHRRFRVWEMHKQGYRQQAIADALGLSQSGVSRIIKRGREGGKAALKTRQAPGAKPRLSQVQKAELLEKLKQGAEAFGFEGAVWTTRRIARLIEDEFGVHYHPDYIGPLLRGLGWSWQKPSVKATQRDEQAIQEWLEKRWLEIKEKAEKEGYTVLFVDESAFYLLPGVVYTWAPKGETPLLRVPLSREHYSAISAISRTGNLYFLMQPQAFDSEAVIRFLKILLEQIAGKILIIWDGASIHRSKVLRQFLSEGGAKRIHLERLPAYAPDLNPDEGVWHYLKHVELGNVCARDMEELKSKLSEAHQRLAAKPEIIQAFFSQFSLV